ncbi:MAG: hypothetical protein CMG14_00635 [Candidatus Marinimicrobia bacterium]|nr:hypothetical protein [Candidatus Neomarinimicrobiota bacterium]|tara:strand:+ start:35418 stop:36038 length:621 start_codon:yes stop_codon:yes gene_type:complete
MIFILLLTLLFASNSNELLFDIYTIDNWDLIEENSNKKIYKANCTINNVQYIMIEQELLKEQDNVLDVIESVSNYNNILSNKNIKTKLLLSKGDTSIVLQTITNAIPFTRDREYIFKMYRYNENRIDWFLLNDLNVLLYDFKDDDSHKLSFGAGSWEIKTKDDKKILIYRMYLDDEVNLPLMFIQKIRINQTVNIFNDVLTFSQGE